VLLIAWNTPAMDYGSLFYRSTPLILWVSLIASVIVGIILVVAPIAKIELGLSYLWEIELLLRPLSYTVCLSLLTIDDYCMWCTPGDLASHIGWD